jgi:adenine-specific DNA methylase
VVVLRNKDFIILYRGKDFITEKVVNVIAERENKLYDEQNIEEEARLKALRYFKTMGQSENNSDSIGSFKEYQDIERNYLEGGNEKCLDKVKLEAEKVKLEKELKDQERKLFIVRILHHFNIKLQGLFNLAKRFYKICSVLFTFELLI